MGAALHLWILQGIRANFHVTIVGLDALMRAGTNWPTIDEARGYLVTLRGDELVVWPVDREGRVTRNPTVRPDNIAEYRISSTGHLATTAFGESKIVIYEQTQ